LPSLWDRKGETEKCESVVVHQFVREVPSISHLRPPPCIAGSATGGRPNKNKHHETNFLQTSLPLSPTPIRFTRAGDVSTCDGRTERSQGQAARQTNGTTYKTDADFDK